MQTKQLGNTNLNISAIGLGCMAMSDFYGPTDTAESIATLHRAIGLGVNFFDTADMYGTGANEELLGRELKPFRSNIILATKFGFVRDPHNPHARVINAKPDYVKAACDASLQRLQTDVIDLYYLHRVDATVPIEDTVGAMSELVQAGKVRYIGLSEASANTIKRAHKIHPITAIQSEYSLWSREPEEEVIPLCEQLNISFVPYSPLGRGFLTNTVTPEKLDKTDFRSTLPRLSDDNLVKNQLLVAELAKIATQKNYSAAQLALAWVIAKSSRIIPIPGTRRRKYLEENIAATNIPLSKTEVAQLDELFKPDAVAGNRYSEVGMGLVGL